MPTQRECTLDVILAKILVLQEQQRSAHENLGAFQEELARQSEVLRVRNHNTVTVEVIVGKHENKTQEHLDVELAVHDMSEDANGSIKVEEEQKPKSESNPSPVSHTSAMMRDNVEIEDEFNKGNGDSQDLTNDFKGYNVWIVAPVDAYVEIGARGSAPAVVSLYDWCGTEDSSGSTRPLCKSLLTSIKKTFCSSPSSNEYQYHNVNFTNRFVSYCLDL
ncbi:unnamed protein product, partial [Iphiclides podalirius]